MQARKKMKLLLVCFSWCFINTSAYFHLDPYEDTPLMATVKNISKEIDTSCIVLLHTVRQLQLDTKRVIDLIESLAMDFIIDVSVTALTFQKFLNILTSHDFYLDCKSPVILIIHDDEETRTELRKLSQKLPMHDAMWVVYANVSLDSWFTGINIPFSCHFVVAHEINSSYVLLHEIYRVTPDRPLRSPIYGIWTRDFFSVQHDIIYNRRSDLEGMLFRTGSTQNYPIHSFVENPETGQPELVGYFPEIWKQLETLLNFTSVHYPSVDNVTGIKEKNGSWNGLIGMLLSDQIDVAVSEFIMDIQRSHVVDFSRPLVKTSYQIFFKNVGVNHNWDAILRPFQTDIWVATLVWLLVGACILAFVHLIGCQYELEEQTQHDDFNLINALFFQIKALCGQGHHAVPGWIPCRIIYICAYLVNCVLVPSYAAYLISYLTFRTPKRPFDNLQGMLDSKSYRLQTNSKTSEYTYFSEATDPVLQRIFRELMVDIPADELPLNTRDALDRVCNDPYLAHFGDLLVASTYLEYVKIHKKCDIVTFSQSISTIYSSMALRRHSPYRMPINHHLQKMEDYGLIDRTMDMTFPHIRNLPQPTTTNVEVDDVAQAFFLLLIGYGLAWFILLVEIIYNRWRNNQQKKLKKIEKLLIKSRHAFVR